MASVQVELNNETESNVWFRFCYETDQRESLSMDIHEAVIPKGYRRVYIKIPSGAGTCRHFFCVFLHVTDTDIYTENSCFGLDFKIQTQAPWE
mgnify:CR=1 FL=1